MDAKLHAVDADTGQPCADFGQGGVLDFNAFNTTDARWPLSLLQPPTVFGDTLFLGWAGKDWAEAVDSPGSVYALDARTGAVKWTFETLPPEVRAKTGTANVWASMSVDPERHLLYIPVSSPSPNFFQGAVPLDLPVVTSVTALDTDTGALVWTRQLVHHDLWDLDTNAAPTLVDIEKDGRTIPALVQTSKQGFLYVLDRTTGEPVYPDRGAPGPADRRPGRDLLAHAALRRPPRARHPRPLARRLQARRLRLRRLVLARGREAPRRGLLHPPSLRGTPRLPRHRRRHRMGRRRGRPVERHLRRQFLERGADLPADPPRRLRRRRRPRRRDRRLLAA